jgi:hypothetical protein
LCRAREINFSELMQLVCLCLIHSPSAVAHLDSARQDMTLCNELSGTPLTRRQATAYHIRI